MPASHGILVVGVGSIGERHVRCFQATGRATVAIHEINAELGLQVAQRYGATLHDTFEAALAARPEAAVIATPAPFHVPQATRLLQAGVHVLIEKPLSTSTDGVEPLRQLAAHTGLVAAVAYVQRCQPGLAAIKQALDEGRFGEPLTLVATTGQHFPTYRPAYREIYYRQHSTGGGAIQDALTHIVNAGEWLLGPVTRLVADAAHLALEGVQVEDTVHLLARHGQTMASYSLNQHQAPNELTLTVVCKDGTMRFEPHESRWRWMAKPGDAWHDEPIPPMDRDSLYVMQAHRFLDCLESRAVPLCTLDEGLQTLRVNLAALASAESCAWQEV